MTNKTDLEEKQYRIDNTKSIKTKKQLMGKKARASGQRFELRVGKDMEKKGWIVVKFTKNVEFDYDADKFYNVKKCTTGLLVKAKPKFIYNPQLKRRIPIGMNSGFPDFVCWRQMGVSFYEIIGVESKMEGILDKEEKLKCQWILENNVFSRILIASKNTFKRGVIVYKEFSQKSTKASVKLEVEK